MNAILIDPSTETIKLVHLNNFKLEEMKKVIDCDLIELAITFEDLKVDIYCDEEGWLRNGDIYGFEFDGVLIPSKALVVGCTEDGRQIPLNKVKTSLMLNLLLKGVVWRGQLTEEDMPQPQVFTFEDLLKQDSFNN